MDSGSVTEANQSVTAAVLVQDPDQTIGLGDKLRREKESAFAQGGAGFDDSDSLEMIEEFVMERIAACKEAISQNV